MRIPISEDSISNCRCCQGDASMRGIWNWLVIMRVRHSLAVIPCSHIVVSGALLVQVCGNPCRSWYSSRSENQHYDCNAPKLKANRSMPKVACVPAIGKLGIFCESPDPFVSSTSWTLSPCPYWAELVVYEPRLSSGDTLASCCTRRVNLPSHLSGLGAFEHGERGLCRMNARAGLLVL